MPVLIGQSTQSPPPITSLSFVKDYWVMPQPCDLRVSRAQPDLRRTGEDSNLRVRLCTVGALSPRPPVRDLC